MHLRVTETAEASLAEAVAEASNKATVVVLRYMAWQRYHFHWAKHNGSGEFIATYDTEAKLRKKGYYFYDDHEVMTVDDLETEFNKMLRLSPPSLP